MEMVYCKIPSGTRTPDEHDIKWHPELAEEGARVQMYALLRSEGEFQHSSGQPTHSKYLKTFETLDMAEKWIGENHPQHADTVIYGRIGVEKRQ